MLLERCCWGAGMITFWSFPKVVFGLSYRQYFLSVNKKDVAAGSVSGLQVPNRVCFLPKVKGPQNVTPIPMALSYAATTLSGSLFSGGEPSWAFGALVADVRAHAGPAAREHQRKGVWICSDSVHISNVHCYDDSQRQLSGVLFVRPTDN